MIPAILLIMTLKIFYFPAEKVKGVESVDRKREKKSQKNARNAVIETGQTQRKQETVV